MDTVPTRERRERVSLFLHHLPGRFFAGRTRSIPSARPLPLMGGRTDGTGNGTQGTGGRGCMQGADRRGDMDLESENFFALLGDRQETQRLAAPRRFPSALVPVRANTLAL